MRPALTMRVLVLDAAGAHCLAAMVQDGQCLAVQTGGDSRAAAAALPGMVAALGGFAAVAVTTGPGSFTGLRAAIAFAEGLALGAGVPVVGVALAEALREAAPQAWVALDSRRPGRLFLDHGAGMQAVSWDALPRPAATHEVVGDAAAALAARLGLTDRGIYGPEPAWVAAVALRALASGTPPPPRPLYLEPPEARAAPLRPAPA